jgi:hypothetical protein
MQHQKYETKKKHRFLAKQIRHVTFVSHDDGIHMLS